MIIKIIFIFLASFIIQYYPILGMDEKIDENESIVRIWEPKGGLWGNYGHVSLQTSEYYVSFWPENIKNCISPQTGVIMINLNGDEGDKYGYGRKCDKSYKLNSEKLNKNFSVDFINKEFSNFLLYNNIDLSNYSSDTYNSSVNNSQYHVAGRLTKNSFYKHPQSCTTFAFNLLIQGGGGFDNFLREELIILNTIGKGDYVNKVMTVSSFKEIIETSLQKKEEENCIIY